MFGSRDPLGVHTLPCRPGGVLLYVAPKYLGLTGVDDGSERDEMALGPSGDVSPCFLKTTGG